MKLVTTGESLVGGIRFLDHVLQTLGNCCFSKQLSLLQGEYGVCPGAKNVGFRCRGVLNDNHRVCSMETTGYQHRKEKGKQ
jgi:hypothetical protein